MLCMGAYCSGKRIQFKLKHSCFKDILGEKSRIKHFFLSVFRIGFEVLRAGIFFVFLPTCFFAGFLNICRFL